MTIFAFVCNLWVPFFFELRDLGSVEKGQYCDVSKKFSKSYFNITIIYVFVIMLIPIIIIFLCNSLIIMHVYKAGKARNLLIPNDTLKKKDSRSVSSDSIRKPSNSRKSFIEMKNVRKDSEKPSNCLTVNNSNYTNVTIDENLVMNQDSKKSSVLSLRFNRNRNNRATKKRSNETKVTKMLTLMSLSYAILNLPYFISWATFFYFMAFNFDEFSQKDRRFNLFTANNITEIFYVLNYGIHFFIYCASGHKFRSQLKDALIGSKN
jgi:hypothetical protein